MNPIFKLFLDFFPLGGFFLGYKFGGLMLATATIIALTMLSLTITYLVEKKLSPAPLISGLLVAALGGLTLALQNETFIKMKPTFVNLVFAAILLIGLSFKKPLLKYALDAAFQLTEEGWRKLTLRWGIFFVALALLNEMIWRTMPEAFWVDFKVFGILPLTLAFAALQWPLVRDHNLEQGNS